MRRRHTAALRQARRRGSANALPAVATRVHDFVPWYSSVHRGAGYKSRTATDAYERARAAIVRFSRRTEAGQDVAIICRNTTEAINHLAYRLRLNPDDIVVTTVIEHHANLLPWARVARLRFVSNARPTARSPSTTSSPRSTHRPARSCWPSAARRTSPAGCHRSSTSPERHAPVGSRCSSMPPSSPHRPLVGPRHAFAGDGDPFLAGGGAVDLVDLDEVVWTDPPEREEAGSPNVIGAVALHAAIDEFEGIGGAHRTTRRAGQAAALRSRRDPRPHRARTRSQYAEPANRDVHNRRCAPLARRGTIERRARDRRPPGCFCAHPYLLRLLHLSEDQVHLYRRDAVLGRPSANARGGASQRHHRHVSSRHRPPPRCGHHVANGSPTPVRYQQDEHTGDFWPDNATSRWTAAGGAVGASCAAGLTPAL